jgi:hypothetical protein
MTSGINLLTFKNRTEYVIPSFKPSKEFAGKVKTKVKVKYTISIN